MEIKTEHIHYFENRQDWRGWLEKNFRTEPEAWFIFPRKHTGKPGVSYNDAVEEALCFGWIDSIIKSLDPDHSIQRFTPRRKGSPYSQPNTERIKWLFEHGLIHPDWVSELKPIADQPFDFPYDIISIIKKDAQVWQIYQNFSESYKRIRIAYIDGARTRPDEFQKRLANFISKTRKNKIIVGHGGVGKYYCD